MQEFFSKKEKEKRKFFIKKYGKHHDNADFENSEIRDNRPVEIGNDVWIGRECVIMPGVKIGDGAIVAAYSVVVKDIPPYWVAGGNPAKPLKPRFDEELTALLLDFRWWDLPPEQLADWLPLLCDPDLEKLRRALRAAKH